MKQENYTELQLLKRQVNELRDEVYNLKNSFKSISYKSYNDQTLGRFIGKTIGNTIFKNNNSAYYNQQLIAQVSKVFTNSINVPSSFGEN